MEPFGTWCNYLFDNISVYSDERSLKNDFIPRYYQNELVSTMLYAGKIVFLPTEQDKLHIVLQLVKHATSEMRSSKKCIIYAADSPERSHRVYTLLRKHANLNTTHLSEQIHSVHLLVCSCNLPSLGNTIEDIAQDVLFLILDDCSHSMTEHPLSKLVPKFLEASQNKDLRIIGLTSTLIHRNIGMRSLEDDDLYEYFVQMEKTLKSVILTSHDCNAVKKYLTKIKFKLVKYKLPKSWMLRSDASEINSLIEFFNALINRLNYSDNDGKCIKSRLKSLLNDFMRVSDSHGLFPSFVCARLSRIALEKLKLFCSNDSLFIAVSAIISDFDVISSWLERAIQESGPPSDESVIKNCCDVKILKTWSQLSKMDMKENCVIFVRDSITAEVLTYVLQKLAALEGKTFPLVDYVSIESSNQNFRTDREELYQKKNARNVLKKFLQHSINVLILTWETFSNVTEVDSDWIFYFDLPPDYISYIISMKYGNGCQNEHYFFVEDGNEDVKKKVSPFVNCHCVFQEVLRKKNVFNQDQLRKSFRTTQMTEEKLSEVYSIYISEEVPLYSAINIVNRYCESLPTDAFTRVAPRWTTENQNGRVTCKLKLPLEPSIRFTCETEPVNNLEITKQVAALKTTKILKELRHVDDKMLPQIREVDADIWHDESLFPMWRDEREEYEAGTSNCCRVVPIAFPEWLYDCAPQADVDCYVHVIHLIPAYEEPDNSRKKFLHELLKSQEEFGIVTRKKLPDICQFPVFTDLGQVDVSIKVNKFLTRFTDQQIDDLFSFHRFVFMDVLKVVKGFLVSDRSCKENSYFVAPLRINDDGEVELAWDVINNAYIEPPAEPSEEERVVTDYINKKYVGKIITPWYRVIPERNYVVTKKLKDSSPSCPFTSDEHQTFTTYYSDKYGLDVKQPIQPLLEAKSITANLNCIRPRAQTPGTRRKRGERELDFDEILLPEFCVLQPFPAVYWYKSITLLAIAHRLHHILLAETIRQRVAAYGRNSSLRPWPSDEIDILKADVDCISEYEESSKMVTPIASILKDVKLAKRKRMYPWADERLPIDVDRNLNGTCILELMIQHDFMEKSNLHIEPHSENIGFVNILQPVKFYPRFLEFERELSPGPKQSDIYQALTTTKCGDVVNLKFFKIIGRSYLKFAASLLLYRLYPNLNVLQLKRLRGKLISKKNLFYCCSKINLGSYLKLHDVSSDDWNFGGFSIPEQLLKVISESGIAPEVIFNLEIPPSEQASGIISPETRNELHEKTLNYYTETTREANFLDEDTSIATDHRNHVLIYFKKQCVPDKAVVDTLKSLTGVYLMNCGVDASFKYLQYLEVLKRNITMQELFVANSNDVDVYDLYNQIFVSRKFESWPLFVQAFTHHSCYPENSSECNQKLALLGNALLDFLITGYVFEHRDPYTTLSDLEDLRIALVNDVLFAVVLVRTGLHKHIQIQSPTLIEKVDKFVTQQQRVKHRLNNHEYLFLVEETSHLITSMVDVPKILPDTFKALMAAVFIETGSLKHVWRICYTLLKSEIDTFLSNIPKNPIKIFDETDVVIEYEKPKSHEYDPALQVVNMHVKIDDTTRMFTGVGEDTQQAKIIAAKLALKNLSKHFTL